ncbi:GntR family transcriptional regulator [Actinokineospora diospyrosa]|uniref:GntR family transcriptional regulator n=1 Tax=Actinokineospora diospyrosa TaxID=103728 RepID=A0ABT1I7K1_9PSEU|nr:GntR family transcriptional regulator [Actinokineospora diospyrosa]
MERVGYRAIADGVRGLIDSGELGAGDRVPSENELMATYGVEQPTARRALEVLKNEGLIVARRGAGTFVREFRPYRRVSPDRLRSWGAGTSIWAADDERRPVVAGVEVAEELPPGHIGRALDLADGDLVLVRRRSYVVEGKPIQLAETYYPAELVRGSRIAEPDTGPGGAYARLADLGAAPVRFREELRSRMPREEERKALDLAQGTPVICVVRTAYTADGTPVEVNEMTLDAGSYVLEYHFTAE